MPLSKLTLNADKEVIRQAKQLASDNQTSVSAMVGRFLRALWKSRTQEPAVGPLTRKASGLVELGQERDKARLLADALSDRHQP